MKKVKSSQASISINSCAELSKTQSFTVSVVKSIPKVLELQWFLDNVFSLPKLESHCW